VEKGEESEDQGAVDESHLDRARAIGECGYPTGGEQGYGFATGQRLDNVTGLIDCEGEAVELASSFCPRSDEYGDYNRAILVTLGAGWCAPCVDETSLLMPEVYEPLNPQGVEVVQVLYQDDQGLAPTKSFCTHWRDEAFTEPLAFPVFLDQTSAWADLALLETGGALPMNFLVDANANIRRRWLGEAPQDLVEQIETVLASPYGP
jgi:hypothetical protein